LVRVNCVVFEPCITDHNRVLLLVPVGAMVLRYVDYVAKGIHSKSRKLEVILVWYSVNGIP
jgi:hypothetical protein